MSHLKKVRERTPAEDARRKVIIATCVAFFVGIVSVVAIMLQLTGFVSRYSQSRTPQSAADYFTAGVQLKGMGKVELARASLKAAIAKADRDPETKVEAERFLRTRIPVKPVNALAERYNIEAFNADAGGDTQEAKRIWAQTIKDYPDFEWPYGNLAAVHLEEGDIESARSLATQVLEKNPHYFNAIMVLAKAQIAAHDMGGAKATLERALQEIPKDHEATMLYRRVTAPQRRLPSS